MNNLNITVPEFIVMGGDFNTPLERIDKKGGNPTLKQSAINEIKSMKERFGLIDILRAKHPFSEMFSWEMLRPTIIQERLDYLLVTKNLENSITNACILPKSFSDHGNAYGQHYPDVAVSL